MRFLVLAGAVAAAAVPASAAAWPVLDATGTETVDFLPGFPLVRTTFTVDFAGTGPVSDRFTISRIDGNQMLRCTAPPGWSAGFA